MQVRKHPVKYFQNGLSKSGIICGGLVSQVSVMLSFYERNG